MGHTRAADALLRVHARGLARLVSRPAYRRLLDAEPLLRRAVPVLIVVFLAAVALGAAVQILDHRRQALADNEQELSLLAFAASEAARCPSTSGSPISSAPAARSPPSQAAARRFRSSCRAARNHTPPCAISKARSAR